MIAMSRRLILCSGAVLALAAAMMPATADTRLNAHYKISMVGVSIGQLTWTIDVNATPAAGVYRASANGKASGALGVLLNGEGRVGVQGTVSRAAPEDGGAWQVAPRIFSSNVTDDGVTAGLQMTFEDGAVKTLRRDEPLPNDGRIPVSEADMRGVSDPLSAMLIAPRADDGALTPENCDRLLTIFDGLRRYDLALSFKRIDKLKIDRGYAGAVLVCAVVLHPIAGYRADSLLVKYVSGRQGMEIWFAPIAGTVLAAPARLIMPTTVGTLEIAADRFEAAINAPANAGAPKP
jgi:Protein of unknown function (DUF3108)